MDKFWIDPYLYIQIYYAILVIVTFGTVLSSNGTLIRRFNTEALILVGFIVVYWAFRPITHEAGLADTKAYALFFTLAQEQGEQVLNYKDPGYMFVIKSLLSFPIELFFWILALFYVGTYTVAYKYIYRDKYGLALIILICSFSFFGYGVNGVRNGVALAFVSLGLSLLDKKKFLFILFSLIGFSFHKSAILPIAAICLAQYYNKSKVYLNIWIVCIILSLLFGNMIASMVPKDFFGDDRLSEYLNAQYGNQKFANFSYTGFRFDFLLYSAVPVFIGRNFLRDIDDGNNFYRLVYNVYLICNSFWILAIYVPYNNRFAYLSWFLYPILITYPFFKNSDILNNKIKLLIFLNFIFTFLMWLKE